MDYSRFRQVATLLGFVLVLLSGCRSGRQGGGGDERFFLPARSDLVYKYYLHYRSADGQQNWTDIRYYRYEEKPSGQLELLVHGPDLQQSGRLRFAADPGGIRLLEHSIHWQGEVLQAAIREPHYLSWQGDSAVVSSFTAYPGGITETVERVQLHAADSLILGRPAKVLRFLDRRRYAYPDGTERSLRMQTREIYVRDLGLFSTEFERDDGTARLELAEQMTPAGWEDLSARVPPRVAYIDPADRLDQMTTFQPCEESGRIADYYNGDPDAGYPGGKRALRALFQDKLKPELLGDQSGYLTFRFVVNCRGEAGWFITESADLDFNAKRFPERLVRHVLRILQEAESWRATVVEGQKRDAYVYLTLKLNDGEVVDLLP